MGTRVWPNADREKMRSERNENELVQKYSTLISLPGSFHVGDEADEPENGQGGEDLRDQLRPVPTHVQETLQILQWCRKFR